MIKNEQGVEILATSSYDENVSLEKMRILMNLT